MGICIVLLVTYFIAYERYILKKTDIKNSLTYTFLWFAPLFVPTIASNLATIGVTIVSNEYMFPLTFTVSCVTIIIMLEKIIGSIGRKTNQKERMQIKKYKEYSTNGIDTEYIFSIYYIAYQYGMLKSRTDILGAILLKWVIDGKITIEDNKIGGLIAEYGEFPLLYEGCKIEDILNKSFENELEKELYYRIMIPGKDGTLTKRELKRCTRKNSRYLYNWFSSILKQKENEYKLILDDAIRIKEFKNYLENYEKISSGTTLDTKFFEQCLIYATLFGITKKVKRKFEKIEPEIISKTNFKNYNNLKTILKMSKCVVNICIDRECVRRIPWKHRSRWQK